jgi:Spy/CpxP family protein refolding chaperone
MREKWARLAICWCLATLALSVQATPPAQALLPLGQVELTNSQRERLFEIRRDLHQRHCELTARIIDMQERIRGLLSREGADAQLAEALRELGALQQQLAQTRESARTRAEELLTAEQRATLSRWRAAQPPPSGQPRLLWQHVEPDLYPYPPRNVPAER